MVIHNRAHLILIKESQMQAARLLLCNILSKVFWEGEVEVMGRGERGRKEGIEYERKRQERILKHI